MIVFGVSSFIFLGLLLFIPEDVSWGPRVTIAVMVYGVLLWALEPIPLGMTSVLTLVLLLLLNAVPIDTVLSGFASPAVFLIIAGMMIAQGVNQTSLMDRITYTFLERWGNSAKTIFIGFFLLMQVQAFFIPATAVRVTLMIPIVLSVIEAVGAKKGSNFSKLMLVGTAFAGNISGTAILTAAVGNILTIEILQIYTGGTLSYFSWFLYAFPIWLLLILIIPFMIWRQFPTEAYSFQILQKNMKEKKEQLGPISKSEKKCLLILSITVILWMTESLHGYHPTVPALLAVVLMAMPRIGFVEWKAMVKVNFNMVLLIGATLSLGFALIQSGAIELLADLFTANIIVQAFGNPWVAIILVVVVSQFYHLGVTNVSTAVVTLLPVLIGLSLQVGLDPVVVSFVSSITLLFGFILVVETMPNVVVHGTGLVEQKDFYIPGIWGTVISTIITIIVAFTWWKWLGFWP
ncbi:DASS family sodium-coupled anion symporter [Oceanobacillus halophilus]|uniref:Sodium-dependent dicarboxylate transporter SdcS n=2 Tax=Oceanobacillus halophilus TaxID=930130 RepID=A0A495A812_9BACI|nr:DASS family sodium-coupled anion symporter [Oceanobacillus halophilus]